MPYSEFHKKLMALGFMYVEAYRTERFSLDMIVKFPSIRHTIVAIYHALLSHKQIVAIASLTEQVKNELWTICKPYTAGMTKGEAIEFVKCYWALDQLADMKNES